MTDLFWKTTAGILVAVILILAVQKQEKDLALMLGILACAMAGMAALRLLEPVLDFLYRLENLGNFQSGILGRLLKILGIGMVTEIAGAICQDSGNGALGRGMQMLGSAMMLMLSLPVLETLLDLVQEILGEL